MKPLLELNRKEAVNLLENLGCRKAGNILERDHPNKVINGIFLSQVRKAQDLYDLGLHKNISNVQFNMVFYGLKELQGRFVPDDMIQPYILSDDDEPNEEEESESNGYEDDTQYAQAASDDNDDLISRGMDYSLAAVNTNIISLCIILTILFA